MITVSQLFLSDDGGAFSKSIGWTKGERNGRYAIVIDHGSVVYAENEPGGDVTVTFSDRGLCSKVNADEIEIGLWC